MPEIDLKFTHAAKVSAVADSSVEAVGEHVRGEIAELLDDGLEILSDLVFHNVETKAGNWFICTPIDDHTIEVDACEFEDIGEVKRDDGLFDGKKIMMPRKFSEGNEQ